MTSHGLDTAAQHRLGAVAPTAIMSPWHAAQAGRWADNRSPVAEATNIREAKMTLSSPTPILRIFDEAKAKEFYISFLGFSVDWEHRFENNLPLYMQVSKDSCIIHLSEHYGDSSPGSTLRIKTDDVAGMNRELLQKAYKYARPGVELTPWKTKEMKIADPFGNHLIFFEDA